ncbi:YtxH domain-containing protein [Metabacillus iocasae]|uniref:Gas vesicle protein n=1 Tax=Priestia iocasae TaxID=2291674 RepID=A0ABS2QP03_9BACI|nr:YtxH domain-containing protein [Metabacillus iocasae]MBM7701181.1 gas vesicle protein [Metabacillus iocasae]
MGKEKEGLSSKDFLLGSILGGVVGAATALLLAPKAGKELRSDLNEQATFVRLKTEQIANTAKDKTTDLSQAFSEQSAQVVNKIKSIGKKEAEQEELPQPSLDILEDEVESQHIEQQGDVQKKLQETQQALQEFEENVTK